MTLGQIYRVCNEFAKLDLQKKMIDLKPRFNENGILSPGQNNHTDKMDVS